VSDELKAAANRFQCGIYGSLEGSHTMQRLDANLLARAYLADLAAREAEERERSLPIDEGWLIAIGFTKQFNEGVTFCIISSKSHEVEVIRGCVYLAPKNGTFIRIGTALITTRGMMLDFLAGLKIPTKGGAA